MSALDHHVVDNMFNELVAMGPVDGHSSMATYTSVLQSPKPHDELNRHWFVDFKIAVTHFGVKLPDPLQSPVGDGVTLAQATAASKIHEGYLEGEGFKYVMTRFYNLGLKRVSTASHRYAMDFCLWMRGKFVTSPHSLRGYSHTRSPWINTPPHFYMYALSFIDLF